MSIERERRAGSLVDVGLNLIKTVTVIANEDVSGIEKQEFCAKQARLEIENRRLRSEYFDSGFFGEPAWQMLLELYIAHHEGVQFTITNLCLASDEPHSTALRWIEVLEGHGCVRKHESRRDKRLKILTLAEETINQLDHYFMDRMHHLI